MTEKHCWHESLQMKSYPGKGNICISNWKKLHYLYHCWNNLFWRTKFEEFTLYPFHLLPCKASFLSLALEPYRAILTNAIQDRCTHWSWTRIRLNGMSCTFRMKFYIVTCNTFGNQKKLESFHWPIFQNYNKTFYGAKWAYVGAIRSNKTLISP